MIPLIKKDIFDITYYGYLIIIITSTFTGAMIIVSLKIHK